ncbi:MAG: flagellar filament capping protein FliD [Betaproteobacteria bacterium]|uniref:Flagellar filament capping protein FliD n=1 Tax=Candidatus Proximibacter danicus TaxID=2954365 RepID=A0A9D7K1H5_9PROT|nr:flagellar filament capping protein FliD [Candidatus Proximibacter danicus]
MSPLGIAGSLFSLVSASRSDGASQSSQNRASATQGGDFSASLALRMASLQSESINPLLGAGKGDSSFDFLMQAMGNQGASSASSDPLSFLSLAGNGVSNASSLSSQLSSHLSSMGRNLSLFDPESAYRMMTSINNGDATYKAQFSELSEMKSDVAEMQQAGQTLGSGLASLDNEGIKAQLQAFAEKYNEWVGRFDATVKADGVLSGTQAAEVSLYELKQSIENRFNGAMHGVQGMRELGLNIDPTTHMASIDTAKLDAVLTKNREGALSAIGEFSGNFAKSAELLISSNNFIPNRLDNLDRVIDYIADNKTSLQAEFGMGDAAKPSAQVAKALAAYQQMFQG